MSELSDAKKTWPSLKCARPTALKTTMRWGREGNVPARRGSGLFENIKAPIQMLVRVQHEANHETLNANMFGQPWGRWGAALTQPMAHPIRGLNADDTCRATCIVKSRAHSMRSPNRRRARKIRRRRLEQKERHNHQHSHHSKRDQPPHEHARLGQKVAQFWCGAILVLISNAERERGSVVRTAVDEDVVALGHVEAARVSDGWVGGCVAGEYASRRT